MSDVPTPLDSPLLIGSTTHVVIRGSLALAIRDAVQSSRRYHFRDRHHAGPHFQWNDAQWSAFHDWAHDEDPAFQPHAWVLAIDKIAVDPTSPTHICRVFAVLAHPLDATKS